MVNQLYSSAVLHIAYQCGFETCHKDHSAWTAMPFGCGVCMDMFGVHTCASSVAMQD